MSIIKLTLQHRDQCFEFVGKDTDAGRALILCLSRLGQFIERMEKKERASNARKARKANGGAK